jgi:hypothetical protein
VRPPSRQWSRILSALAMLSCGPALLFIEAEAAAHHARSGFSPQANEFEAMLAGLSRQPVSCSPSVPIGRLSTSDIMDFVSSALTATRHVNSAFRSDTLFWSFKNGLPWTSGLYSVYDASGKAQDSLARYYNDLDICHGRAVEVHGEDEAEARLRQEREEKRSQVWLDAERTKLEELYGHLKAAKAAYERDRLKLTAAAWSLGLLQVVGWGSLCLVVIPHDIRSWRARRAERKKGHGTT